jgi:hypothetical protein
MSRADKQIEFAVFCIENTAKRLGLSGQAVYRALCETDGINTFIIPSYDILHTQSKQYIVDETLEYLRHHTPSITLNTQPVL